MSLLLSIIEFFTKKRCTVCRTPLADEETYSLTDDGHMCYECAAKEFLNEPSRTGLI